MKFKYLSMNVWEGGKLFANLIQFLKEQQPDIFSAQEVYNSHEPTLDPKFRTIEEFMTQLGFKYFSFAPSFLHKLSVGNIEMGNAVFSKFPITASSSTFYGVPFKERSEFEPKETFPFVPRNLQHVQIDLNGKTINVFNTHGIWGLDDKDNLRRLKMADTIVESIKDKEYVILSGDFNVGQNTNTIAKVEKNLINILSKRATSFNMRIKPRDQNFQNSVVDFIFVSPGIKVLSAAQMDVDVTDHLPLVAQLEI